MPTGRTILRDGVGQGTYDVNERLSEADSIALMVGRPIDTEYPTRPALASSEIVLSAAKLSGTRFHEIAFDIRRGEILGFAGSEGNGQREALRALGGPEEASGQVLCAGSPVKVGSVRGALDGGILSLSADRAAESIFPAVRRAREYDRAGARGFRPRRSDFRAQGTSSTLALVEKLNIVTADLDQSIGGLSGGQSTKSGVVAQLPL